MRERPLHPDDVSKPKWPDESAEDDAYDAWRQKQLDEEEQQREQSNMGRSRETLS